MHVHCVPSLDNLVRIIRASVEVDAIYLYGSRARGRGHVESDWDIAVLFSTFEPDILERLARPQRVEEVLERELGQYNQLSVVDLEFVPPPLQMNIIRGKRLYDRMVPHVRKVEHSIISKIEKDYLMRDILYEREIRKHITKMIRILDEYKDVERDWTEIDTLAVERALQILVESVIGLSRYVLGTCYGVDVSRTREAIHELKRLGELTSQERDKLNKIIGYRNVLVHDYLNVDENITMVIIKKQEYAFILQIVEKLIRILDEKNV